MAWGSESQPPSLVRQMSLAYWAGSILEYIYCRRGATSENSEVSAVNSLWHRVPPYSSFFLGQRENSIDVQRTRSLGFRIIGETFTKWWVRTATANLTLWNGAATVSFESQMPRVRTEASSDSVLQRGSHRVPSWLATLELR